MKAGVVFICMAAALATAGCSAEKHAAASSRADCPRAWKAGWQKLANEIKAPVYCPTWMPSPLTAQIGGEWANGVTIDKSDRSYLASFLYHESNTGDVHVNLRGYPGRIAIPTCVELKLGGGTTRRERIPCFADPHGHRRAEGIDATVYTVNQNVDQWHVLYAWHRKGSLYTLSEHVAMPLTYRKVVQNLDRMLRGLVLVQPTVS